MENTIAPHAMQNVSVVAFKLNQRTFALPLDVIMQILPMMTITPIPHLSHIVQGTINIRGEDVLVINLRTLFNMEEVEFQLYTPLLLLKIKDRSLALVVDAVLDVMNLPMETLTDLGHMLPDGIENIPLLQGVSRFNDDTILVLDPNHLFHNQATVAQPRPTINFGAIVDELAREKTSAPAAPAETAATGKKSAGKKSQAVKKISAPIEETPIMNSAPVVEETPADASAPAEETVPPVSADTTPTENE